MVEPKFDKGSLTAIFGTTHTKNLLHLLDIFVAFWLSLDLLKILVLLTHWLWGAKAKI